MLLQKLCLRHCHIRLSRVKERRGKEKSKDEQSKKQFLFFGKTHPESGKKREGVRKIHDFIIIVIVLVYINRPGKDIYIYISTTVFLNLIHFSVRCRLYLFNYNNVTKLKRRCFLILIAYQHVASIVNLYIIYTYILRGKTKKGKEKRKKKNRQTFFSSSSSFFFVRLFV